MFPIVVGTGPHHSSSRPFPHVPSRDYYCSDEADGSEVLQQQQQQQQQQQNAIMAMGTNDGETLNATMFITYHCLPIGNDDFSKGRTSADNDDDDDDETRALIHGEASASRRNNFATKNEVREQHSRSSPLDQQNTETQFNVVAELRVQITPITSPFTSNLDATSNRETKSRVPLGMMRKRSRQAMQNQNTFFTPSPSIEFSSNNGHLACLIPIPREYELLPASESRVGYSPTSTIVIFRIQAKTRASQRQQRKHNLPKLPEYILENSFDQDRRKGELENEKNPTTNPADELDMSGVPMRQKLSFAPTASFIVNAMSYVAHGPKIVRALQCLNDADELLTQNNEKFNRPVRRNLSSEKNLTRPLHHATCMCNFPSDHFRGESSSAGSLLLVGTIDGKLLTVDYSMSRMRSIVLEPVIGIGTEDHDDGARYHPMDLREQNGGQVFNSNRRKSQHSERGSSSIVHLSQCTPTHWKPLDIYGEEQGSLSNGHVAAVFRDGSVNIYATSFVPISRFNDDSSAYPRRRQRNRNNGAEHTGLDIQFHLIASSFRPSLACLDASLSHHLRYIRAKWIKPSVLALLTRSPILGDDAFIEWSDNMSGSQSEMVVAQVWSVAAVMHLDHEYQNECDWEIPSNDTNIALISELKLPHGDSLNEFIHDTFSLSQYSSNPVYDCGSNLNGRLGFPDCTRGMSILYHRFIDCLAIGSQDVSCTSDSNGTIVRIRPICLIWDWKRNIPGLTLACSNSYSFCDQDNDDIRMLPYSWFQLGDDDKHGLCAVHVYEQTLRNDVRRACKNVFCLSALSPPNIRATEGCLSVKEPSALLLHRNSVTFPRICRPTNSMDVSLEWAESRVPPTYVASNGPCQFAAVGKDFGRSIAVAASRGLCVLDLSRAQQLESGRFGSPRWKMFSNVNDEHRFRVVSMIWWESANQDFLLAIVQYKLNDALRLVCWSSRTGIGFGESQLLNGSIISGVGSNDETHDYGVALPRGFRVHSMSLIKDPADILPSSGNESSNRALLLLAHVSHDEPSSCSVKFTLFQLQIMLPNGKQERILTKIISHGSIPMELGSPDVQEAEVVNGIFLAGGSFLFNLDMSVNDSDSHNDIAVIGILTMYHGFLAVCVRPEGNILHRPSLLGPIHEGRHRLYVSYWAAGSVSSCRGSRIAWNVAQNDGEVYCWSVPCTNAASFEHQFEGTEESSSDILFGIEQNPIFGEFCYLGTSSLWMNGAATSEREVALGPIIPQSFGSTLYAGQRCRMKIAPSDPGDMTSFHVSNFTVAPPRFTPFLFVSFLILSLKPSYDNDTGWQLRNCHRQGSSQWQGAESSRHRARDIIHSTLYQVRNLGSCSSALRILALKVIELLNDSKVKAERARESKTPDGTASDSAPNLQRWEVGKKMLIEIVSVASMIYDKLGFATFFLSIGRQLEPHQFNLFFPLPKGSPAATAEDLFILGCEHGSLLTALSALPLFSCHKGSQRSVAKLVYHCLFKVDESFRSCFSNSAITSVEDERFLHQLFWFGVKLEDAIELGNYLHDAGDGLARNSQSGEVESILDSSFSIVSSSPESVIIDAAGEFGSAASDPADNISDTSSSDESFDGSFLSRCQTPKQKPSTRFFQRVTRVWVSSGCSVNDSSQEEDAIHEAASSFILSGLGEASIMSHDNDIQIYNSTSLTSVAGAVCLFIDHEIVSGGRENEHDILSYGWKAVSLVAHLLQGDRETSAIASAGSANAKAISRMLTIQDFFAAYPSLSKVGDGACCVSVVGLLESITLRCRQQIHFQALNSVFNLVLLLLLRNDACLDVNLCRPTLVVVGIVSGHLSGRIGELLDLAETSTINSIYSLYAARIKS